MLYIPVETLVEGVEDVEDVESVSSWLPNAAQLGQMSSLSLRQGFSHRSPRFGDFAVEPSRYVEICSSDYIRFTLVTSV